jgi:hypothetical protein
VRIERAKHARNRAFVDGLIGIQRVGEVFLDYAISLGKRLEAALDIVFVGCCGDSLLVGRKGLQQRTKGNDKREVE